MWEQGYAAVGLTAIATLVKGWNDFKKYTFKMDMSKFAYTSYERPWASSETMCYQTSTIGLNF